MEASGQLHPPGRFIPGENGPLYPLEGRVDAPQSRYGRCGVEKNLQPVLGIEPRLTSRPFLYWLSYPYYIESSVRLAALQTSRVEGKTIEEAEKFCDS
jgi:hypothetical protein